MIAAITAALAFITAWFWPILGTLVTFLTGALGFFKPIFKWLGETAVKVFGFGLSDIFDNMKTALTVLTLLLIAFSSGCQYRKSYYPALDLDFRATYKTIPRTYKERKAYLARTNKSEWNVFWSKWF